MRGSLCPKGGCEGRARNHQECDVGKPDGPRASGREPPFGGGAAGGQQHRVGGGRVVDAAVGNQQLDQQHQVCEGEMPVAPAFAPGQEPGEPPEPQRQGKRVDQEHLLRQEAQRGQDHVAPLLSDDLELLQVGEVVLDDPHQVGQEDDEGSEPSEPDPTPGEAPAFGCQEKSNHNGDAEKGHRVLVLEAETGEHPERDPQPLLAGSKEPDVDPGAAGPDQLLEGVHALVAEHHHPHRRRDDRECGQALGEAAPAELAGEETGEKD
jgi:hypothetical protein